MKAAPENSELRDNGRAHPAAFEKNKTIALAEISAPQRLDELVGRAEKAGASDIHLQMTGTSARVAMRLDGLLVPVDEWPATVAERVFGRIKFLARLKTYQESLPQDGRIEKGAVQARSDIRVATYPTVTGEKIVLRLFAPASGKNLDQLELPPEAVAQLKKFLTGHAGLLLLTGPAGSGKTTTIYACLRHLAGQSGRHVITIEDPVEQIIDGVMQTEVNEAGGLNFAVAARHLLRQDPQVLVIGEIRDDETAALAVRAALTGHLVISTLHAGSCHGVMERLLVMCRDRFAVISALALVVNQRLIRRRCPACRGTGCGQCLETGYHGRIPIAEWVALDEPMRASARQSGAEAIVPARSLEDSATRLVAGGVTDPRELTRVFGG